MPKVVLLSQFPLPYAHIGSWTTLYRNYLESNHQIDTIICDAPQYEFKNVRYVHPQLGIGSKLRTAFKDKPHMAYVAALDKVLADGEKYVIQIVDNMGLARAVHHYLATRTRRSDFYLQYFYHGHVPAGFSPGFFEQTDEIVVLTHLAYEAFKQNVNVLPCRFSVLHNGVNTDKFFKVDRIEKQRFQLKHGFAGKRILLWCSQDRPKKGLHIICDAFRTIHSLYPDVALVAIGTESKKVQPGVYHLGRIPNDMLPEYYQMADAFVFPTLCQEGFGLSLIEAMYCGCYCIASALGGVPEVMQDGRFGKLVANPHFVQAWVDALIDFLEGRAAIPEDPGDRYDASRWNVQMDEIISRAKSHFN